MPATDEANAISTIANDQDVLFEKLDQSPFDPVQYLNETLPALTLTSQSTTTTKQSRTSLLQATSADTQSILSRLSTHNVRSSSELTGLTDEIVRRGNRLAYEVEVLRGDANSFYELLTDTLKDDLAQFIIGEVVITDRSQTDFYSHSESLTTTKQDGTAHKDPDFIRQLKTLGLVKARLEAVINIFGEALKWPIAPSEVSMASSLISVSAPELGVANSAEDDKAREYTRQLRNEIAALMESDDGGYAGLELATKRVDNFRLLTQVWKGTSEEKARTRVAEGLIKMVEDRRKGLRARSIPSRPSMDNATRSNLPGRAGRIVEGSSNTAAEFFRKLRDDIYLE